MPSSFGRLSPMNFHCIDGSHLPVLVLITCLFGLAGLFAYLLPWVFFLSLSLSVSPSLSSTLLPYPPTCELSFGLWKKALPGESREAYIHIYPSLVGSLL